MPLLIDKPSIKSLILASDGWAMSQYLPAGRFGWMAEKLDSINKLNLSEYSEDDKKGLIREVDLEYPEKFHDSHNDNPLAPEKSVFPKICFQIIVKNSTKI